MAVDEWGFQVRADDILLLALGHTGAEHGDLVGRRGHADGACADRNRGQRRQADRGGS
jgi:hypothetical protein